MLVKKLVVTAAAGALMLASAAGVFAHGSHCSGDGSCGGTFVSQTGYVGNFALVKVSTGHNTTYATDGGGKTVAVDDSSNAGGGVNSLSGNAGAVVTQGNVVNTVVFGQ